MRRGSCFIGPSVKGQLLLSGSRSARRVIVVSPFFLFSSFSPFFLLPLSSSTLFLRPRCALTRWRSWHVFGRLIIKHSTQRVRYNKRNRFLSRLARFLWLLLLRFSGESFALALPFRLWRAACVSFQFLFSFT